MEVTSAVFIPSENRFSSNTSLPKPPAESLWRIFCTAHFKTSILPHLSSLLCGAFIVHILLLTKSIAQPHESFIRTTSIQDVVNYSAGSGCSEYVGKYKEQKYDEEPTQLPACVRCSRVSEWIRWHEKINILLKSEFRRSLFCSHNLYVNNVKHKVAAETELHFFNLPSRIMSPLWSWLKLSRSCQPLTPWLIHTWSFTMPLHWTGKTENMQVALMLYSLLICQTCRL